jgi:hypothetical protein
MTGPVYTADLHDVHRRRHHHHHHHHHHPGPVAVVPVYNMYIHTRRQNLAIGVYGRRYRRRYRRRRRHVPACYTSGYHPVRWCHCTAFPWVDISPFVRYMTASVRTEDLRDIHHRHHHHHHYRSHHLLQTVRGKRERKE